MANWLFDPVASYHAGRAVFNHPYPGGDWMEQKKNNEVMVIRMEMAWKTVIVGTKRRLGEKLTDDDQAHIDLIADFV